MTRSAFQRSWITALLGLGLLLVLVAVGVSSQQREDDTSGEVAGTASTVPATTTTRSTEPVPAAVPDLRLLASRDRLVDAGCEEAVDIAPPATDLARIVSGLPPGTCFYLAAGDYDFRDVVPKDYMSFVGSSTAEVMVLGDADAENAFHGTATGVTIARMTFIGFQGSGGENRQEQAPIRGTSAIWASDRGQMATEWLVDSIVSSDNYASGIFLGDYFTVRNSRFENNGVTGLSGSEIVGGLIEFNLVTGNGAEQAEGALVNGGGMKFGESGTPDAPLIVRDNEVFDNDSIGIWCDIGCRGFHVIDNYIHDHRSRAIKFELSENALIAGNTIIDSNEWADFSADFNAGSITVGESSSVIIEDNYIAGAESAITIRQTARPVRPEESFLDTYEFVEYFVSDVLVSNNVIDDAGSVGISTGRTGNGLIPDVDSIRFEGNTYDDPDSMQFWWNDGERMDFAGWQAAGRDLEAVGSAVPNVSPRFLGTSTDASMAATDLSQPVSLPIAINAGGGGFVAADGTEWVADLFYIGGNSGTGSIVEAGISDLTEEYRAERWGLRGYSIPIANGDYRVEFHHAELFADCQQPGCRQFSIEAEGLTIVEDLDVFDRVGGFRPLVLASVVTVSDGSLDIRFLPGIQEPQIVGLVIDAIS